MTYELSKKLKDAGFPQSPTKDTKIFYRSTYYSENVDAFFTLTQKEYDLSLEHRDTGSLASVKIPNLSELIEACTKDRNKFSLRNDTLTVPWSAYRDGAPVTHPGYAGNGDTPEEAVANLYLALNQK